LEFWNKARSRPGPVVSIVEDSVDHSLQALRYSDHEPTVKEFGRA